MKLIGLIFLIIYSTDLSSQDLVYFDRLSNHEFTDGTSVGKLHEFGHVFERDDELHTLFKKFNRSRRTQRILNYEV